MQDPTGSFNQAYLVALKEKQRLIMKLFQAGVDLFRRITTLK